MGEENEGPVIDIQYASEQKPKPHVVAMNVSIYVDYTAALGPAK